MDRCYRVLVCDDSSFARRVVIRHLADSEFEVVGEAKSDKEVVELYGKLQPDIVLLDVIMPEKGGTEALRGIIGLNRTAKVMMLSSLGTEDAVTECLSLGASNFVQKPFEKEQLLSAMRKLVGGE